MASPDVGVTAVSYRFLPWVRRGLAVALANPDTQGAMPSRAVANVGVKLAAPLDGEAFAPVAMQLYGPGDVIGIDTGLVVRTDPKPNAHNFEPNYLAIIDFDPPDFPWILTPAKNNDADQLRPWLVLVVLKTAKTGLPRMQPQALMPSIRIAAADVAAELPDLKDSWSWAHAQIVSQAADAGALQADLQGQPGGNVSRLVCPRRLEANTNYVACLVPAFEPGRLRGLGLANDQDPAMQTIAPAWTKGAGKDVVLPVYHGWEFSTGPAGDFESLARRLKTPSAYKGTPLAAALGAVGTAPMSVDPVLAGEAAVALETMEGALVPIKYAPGGAPKNDVQAQSLMAIVNTPADQVVNPVGDDGLNAAGGRLEVKPPMVGGWHIKQQSMQMGELGKHWLADLNLGPRYRGAAGYGAEVVRQNQDAYVDAAWDQLGRILEAERRMNMTRLAIEAQLAIRRRHLDVLPPARLLQLMGPALPRIEALNPADQAYRINGQLASLGGQADRSSLPTALLDTALRRAASPQRRALRMAARMSGNAARLGAVVQSYVTTMAAATRKPAAFQVNAFIPDGIVSSRLFAGLDLAQPTVDLSAVGLGTVASDRMRAIVDAGSAAQRQLAAKGVAPLMIRAGQSLGVFTDVHVERFGTLASNAAGVRGSDWNVVATSIEALGKRGVEGMLVEADTQKATLQFSTMRLDARSGSLRLDTPVLRLNAARKPVRAAAPAPAQVPRAAVAGVNLGAVAVADARKFNSTGLFSALPVNALQTAPAAAAPSFALDQGFAIKPSQLPPARPATVTLTLPPAIRTRSVLNRFAAATRGTQALWRDGFELAHVAVQPVDFALADAAATVRKRTDPTLTLPARLQTLVSIAGNAASKDNFFVGQYLGSDDLAAAQRFMIPALFDRVMAWPKLNDVMYRALAAYDKQAFMPGVDDIPEDMVMLVKVNQYFIDSFMVGANHEMNRELLWRGFPTDLRGTPFQRFWGRIAVAPDLRGITLLDDMLPIHRWGLQPLGRRSDPLAGSPDRVALLVKGQLLRRYPNTAVYAWRRQQPFPAPAQPQLAKKPDGSAADGAVAVPIFSGFIDPDITFFGFEIAQADIPNWCFVLEEQMTEPRFGFDVGDPVPGQRDIGVGAFGAQPRQALADKLGALAALPPAERAAQNFNAWKLLSWNHVGVAAGAYASVQALLNMAPPFVGFPQLADPPTAAQIAKALLQTPFRAYWVGSDLVP